MVRKDLETITERIGPLHKSLKEWVMGSLKVIPVGFPGIIGGS